MTAIVNLSVKMPRWRLRALRVAVPIISPFINNPETGERVIAAMVRWMVRGMKLYADGKRID